MTKYRIRLKNGRVIGPFILSQLHDLKTKGHIQGTEEAQVFPTGDWSPISSFDFYAELMDQDKTVMSGPSAKEETFVIDLSALRNQKNEIEVEKIDVTHHEPVIELTQTKMMDEPAGSVEPKKVSTQSKFELKLDQDALAAQVNEERDDRTKLNPAAQKDLERIRQESKELAISQQAEAERLKVEEEEKHKALEIRKIQEADESTQMIKLDNIKSELILIANEEEQKIELEEKAIRKKKKVQEASDENDKDDEEAEKNKKKRIKLIVGLAIAALVYAMLFPSDDKPKKAAFVHQEPMIEFPIPFDKSDAKKANIDFAKAKTVFSQNDYISIIKAGNLLKTSYENNIEDEDILGFLVRDYAEQLKYSKENKQSDAQVVFNLIQAKRPLLAKNPNGVIGLNLFYMSINKQQAAVDVVSKYLKLYPKNVTPDLFAVYLQSLIKVGKVDLAKQFNLALTKSPIKTRYVYDALIDYALLNQESEMAMTYINEAIKLYPKLVGFYLKKADQLIPLKKFDEATTLLAKAEELNLENNDLNRATFLELKGLLLAYKGDVKTATSLFKKSLEIEDSYELRMKLADLSAGEDMQNETDRLIAESKAIKLLTQSKDFFEKRNYELALSAAAKATDMLPGHIPSELYLAKVQLRLGLAKQALKTLEDLIKKYPSDKSINLALLDAYIETYKFNDAKQRIGTMSGTDLKHSAEFASANARLYIRMGDPLQAISWLRTSINANPLNDNDIYLLSELLIKRANFDAARLLLNKCMELDPINPDYRIAYSKIVYEQQDDLAAIGYLLGLLDEFVDNPKILSEIAIFYYRAGKIKDFEAFKSRIEKLPTKDKTLYEFLIRAALLDERFDDVPGLVENLLRIEPGELEAMMTAGRVMYESGKLVEAAKWFKRIQERLETYPKVQYYIAKIKYLSKDLDGALADVEADIKANGDNDADLILMAQIYVEKGDFVQAENLFKRAQKINSKSYESLMGLADISTKRNNFDLALDLYKKAMKEKGDDPIIHKKIGDVYRLLGQGGLAVESYKLYLEMKPDAPDKNQIEPYINLMQ